MQKFLEWLVLMFVYIASIAMVVSVMAWAGIIFYSIFHFVKSFIGA